MRSSRPVRLISVCCVLAAVVVGCSDDANFVTVGPRTPIAETSTTAVAATTSATTPQPVQEEPATTQPSAETTVPDPTAAAFAWSEVGLGVEEGTLEVPVDYDDPEAGTISLYVVRHAATNPAERIGALLVNPGGPGAGGTILAQFADQIYSPDLVSRFDIVGFDPRGTGLSEPTIDCVDDLEPYFGIETGPDDGLEDAALQEAAKAFVDGCVAKSGELLQHVSTVDAATDIDSIRQALGEEQISYLGWSYGTMLGATWATLFPETVRAAVLDGAINPATGRLEGLVDQAAGFDSTLSTYLAACAAEPTCVFNNGGDTAGAFASILVQVEAGTIASEPGRPAINQGIFELGVAQALYAEEMWPELSASLVAAQSGDGTGLLALYDSYYDRQPDGSYSNTLEAYFVITCADDPDTAGVPGAIAVRDQFLAASRIGSTQAYEVLICAMFPPAAAKEVAITGAGAGPIMVVGNTGDPATPYEGSKVMAETLEQGFFLSVEADTHTAYGASSCAQELIDAYLLDLSIPAADVAC